MQVVSQAASALPPPKPTAAHSSTDGTSGSEESAKIMDGTMCKVCMFVVPRSLLECENCGSDVQHPKRGFLSRQRTKSPKPLAKSSSAKRWLGLS